jgi:hypothetical protein
VTLRVLELNTWHGLYARTRWKVERLESNDEREARIEATIAALREIDADVLFLQECFPQPAHADRLAKALDMEAVHVVANAGIRVLGTGWPLGVGTGEGSSILARRGLHLRPLGERSLSAFAWAGALASFQLLPRHAALAASIRVGTKTVALVTGHVRYDFASRADLDRSWAALVQDGAVEGEIPPGLLRATLANMETRDRELAVLADWLARIQRDADALILGADLNIDDGAQQLDRLTGGDLGLVSALAVSGDARRTWDPDRNPLIGRSSAYAHADGQKKDLASLLSAHHDRIAQRPDHVMLGRALGPDALHEARVTVDAPVGGTLPSDHFGVLAVVKV